MNRRLTVIVEREGDGYVALCPEVDIASQGDTVAEALVLYRYRPTPTARHSVTARSPYLPTLRTRAPAVRAPSQHLVCGVSIALSRTSRGISPTHSSAGRAPPSQP